MRKVYSFSEEEFNNIIKHKLILTIIPVQDLNWNVNLDLDAIDIKVINKQGITFALVSQKSKLSKYKVYFFVYVDEKLRLRAYIPQRGNLYNPWTLSFFGEESPYDFSLKSIRRMPKKYYEEDKERGDYKESAQYVKDFENSNLIADEDLMIKEFLYFHEK